MHQGFNLSENPPGLFKIVAVDFHVDRLLRAEARHAFDEAPRIEEHRDPGEELQNLGAYLVHDLHLVARALVGRREVDGDDGGVRPGIRVEERGATLSQDAGARHDRFQLVSRNLLAQDALDRGHLLFGLLHPLADRRAQDDAELAFVRDRQEFRADLRDQGEGGGEEEQHPGDKQFAVGQHPAERVFESAIQRLIARTAPIHDAHIPARHGPVGFLFRLEKLEAERGSDRAGDEEGREQRDGNGHGERDQQQPCDADDEENRQEDDDGGHG